MKGGQTLTSSFVEKMLSMDYYPGLQITIRNNAVWQDVSYMRLVVLLADFPAVFVHICNFDICHEIQIQRIKIRAS